MLHPERVREYPWVQDLPQEMQEAIYPEDDAAEEELTGLSTDYQYLLSTAPGFKVGGSMSYCVTDGTAPQCKVCAGEMYLLLQMDSTEWDGGSGPRWMPVEERSLERGSTHYADAREPAGVSIGRHSHLGIYVCPADPLHEHQVWGQ